VSGRYEKCQNSLASAISLDPEDGDLAFGLCDLCTGFPELGSVRITELESRKGPLGIGIQRDSISRRARA
jgi:hypothetical protein